MRQDIERLISKQYSASSLINCLNETIELAHQLASDALVLEANLVSARERCEKIEQGVNQDDAEHYLDRQATHVIELIGRKTGETPA